MFGPLKYRQMARAVPVVAQSRLAAAERYFEFSLLGLLASGYLAIAGSGALDPPSIVLAGAGLLLRGLFVAALIPLKLSGRTVTAATGVYIGFYAIDYLYISREFLPATVHLILFLAVAKILTARTPRDFRWVKLIALVEMLAAAVVSSSLNFFLFLALFLVFGVATFATSEILRSTRAAPAVAAGGMRRFERRLSLLTLVTAGGVLALTAALFFLLPRTARVAFQRLVGPRLHIAGFSDDVTLGAIGEIKKRGTPVMHVRLFGDERQFPLKWRGAALAEFDGRRWFNTSRGGELVRIDPTGMVRLAGDSQRWRPGRRINYEVQLEAIGADVLFFAGDPEFLLLRQPTLIRGPGATVRLGYVPLSGVRYGVYSYLGSFPVPDPLAAGERARCLALPPLDPRIAELARTATMGLASDQARAGALEEYLRSRFSYTTELPGAETPDPVAHFLFERRKGHCEYFASAMAVLLRSIGIPSRVVTGFQGGTFNPISGWLVIRASDAHSWVEAHVAGRGWTTFDPTPPDPNPPHPGLLTRLALYLDAADTFWRDWVLNYDLERQLVLAARMEQSSRNIRLDRLQTLLATLTAWKRPAADWLAANGPRLVAVAALAAAALWLGPRLAAWWRARRRVLRLRRGLVEANDATLLYHRMLAVLRRRGFRKPASLTPAEFALTLPASTFAAAVRELTLAYNELRFGGRPEAAPRMIRLLESLEKM